MVLKGLIRIIAPGLVILAGGACERSIPAEEVVLYSSVDDTYLRALVSEFERETGIHVRVKGDTEQVKTFGLVQVVLDERNSPRADVWWSSEPFGSIMLAREGVLEPYEPACAADFGEAGWPSHLKDTQSRWHGVALRARVIAFNTERLEAGDVPRTLRELTDARWRGRVGIANPLFGTTRGHLGAIALEWGDEALEAWLTEMKANGLRVYDGNAAAVRAVAYGEVDICLTDTDDVWAGQRNGWPVDCVYEVVEADGSDRRSFGALTFPTTAGLVKGGPNPDAARTLLEFILSERCERFLAESDSHNVPVRGWVAAEFPRYAIPTPAACDLAEVAERVDGAARIAARVLGLD